MFMMQGQEKLRYYWRNKINKQDRLLASSEMEL